MMTTWQPIETAPRDGTKILVCRRFPFDCWHYDVAKWAIKREHISGWAKKVGEYSERYDENWEWFEIRPTHWMPLPEPPTLTGTE